MNSRIIILACLILAVVSACTTNDVVQPTAARVRKNVKHLTSQEKADFVAAVKKLKTVPSPYDAEINYYDQFVKWHYLAFRCDPSDAHTHGYPAHMGPAFLPWHRVYLDMFEQALSSVSGKQIALPYWDWTDAGSTAAVFSDDVMGGTGDPAQGYAVTTGPFRKGEFPVSFTDVDDVDSIFVDVNTDPNPVPYLTRSIGMFPGGWQPALPTATDVQTTLNVAVYDASPWDCTPDTTKSFRNALEGWRGKSGNFCDSATKNMDARADGSGLRSKMHNVVHIYVGGIFPAENPAGAAAGSMAQNTSPNDPIFWIHHANIDRIWTAWMKRHGRSYLPVTGGPMGHNLNDVMEPFSVRTDGKNTPASVLNESSLDFEYDVLP